MTVTEALLALIAFLLLLATILLAAIVAGTEGPRSALAKASGWAFSAALKVLLYPPAWIFDQVMRVVRLPIYVVQFFFRPLMRFSWLEPPLEFVGFIALTLYSSIMGFTFPILLFWAAVSLAICGSLPSIEAPLSCHQKDE